MTSKNKVNKKICECDCHKDTTGILHEFFPCCHFPNKKYINLKGEIDESRFPKLKQPRKKK